MVIKTIRTNLLSDYEKRGVAEQLETFFSKGELRSYRSQMRAFQHPLYYLSYCMNEKNERVGIMLWWEFQFIKFIEYLCVERNYRRNGIGSSILSVCSSGNKITVLEVAKTSEFGEFYRNNGYVRNRYAYNAMNLNDLYAQDEYDIYSYQKQLKKREYESFLAEIHCDKLKF